MTNIAKWAQTNRIELAAAGLYVLLYLIFWPVSATTMDESAYLNYAWVYQHGTIFSSDLGISAVQSYGVGPGKAHVLTLYPPGMPAILAVFGVFGWGFTLGANLFVHLATFFVLAALLRKMGAPGWLAILYLLHPTATIYSHTLMSDPLSGLLILLAFAACLNKRFAVAGILVGISVFVRTANGVAAGLFALGLALEAAGVVLSAARRGAWAEAFRALLPAITVSLCALPFIGSAWWYQKYIQEGGWAKYSGEGLLSFKHFPTMFPAYLLMLGVIYPGMILAPALYRGANRVLLLTLCYGVLLFYSCFYFQDSAGGRLESFVIGQRFMLAVIPLYLLAYGAVLTRFLGKIRFTAATRAFLVAVALVLFSVTGFGLWKHEKYLYELAAVRQAIAQNVPADAPLLCNIHTAKLLHPAWTGTRKYIVIGGYHNAAADIKATTAQIQSAENAGAKEIYVAIWSRDYRPETSGEQAIANAVTQNFAATLIETGVKGLRLIRIR